MSKLYRAVDESDWVKGPLNAPVTLLEYGDFECAFCGRAFWELKKVERDAAEPFRFVFRHFPLNTSHPHAQLAAEAAEAAGAQGRFWEMYEELYVNQRQLEKPALLTYAAKLRLDLHRFTSDLEEHRHLPKVRRDFLEGVRSGVNGIPALFIDGQRWNGPYTADELLVGLQGGAGPGVEPMTGMR